MKHFEYLQGFIDNNQLILGGATEADPPQGILIFDNASKEDVLKMAESDPYVINKVVKSYKVDKWNAVAGSLIDQVSAAAEI